MVTVIIVNYKVSDLLLDCLESIQAFEDWNNLEIIVVDNHSRDNSRSKILSRFPDIIWIQNHRNLGFASAVNQGFASSHGEVIILINPDCQLKSPAISFLAEHLESSPTTGIAGGRILNEDGSLQPQCRRNFPSFGGAVFRLFGLNKILPNHPFSSQYELPTHIEGMDLLDTIHTVPAVSGAFLGTTRRVIKAVEFLDPEYFLFGEDLDFCYRVNQAKYDVCFHPEAVILHIRGASRQKTPLRVLWHTHKAMQRFYNKHHAKKTNFALNTLVYGVIWGRWLGMIVTTFFRQRLGFGESN